METMASITEVPVIQVLEKEHYFSQALVPLPSAVPYPPLAPSSLLLRTKLLALTVNNFTYAKLGFLAHWWDVHYLSASTPAPYDDPSKYGRLSAWGWAEVLELTHTGVPAGSFFWGYQPIGTLPQDLTNINIRADGPAYAALTRIMFETAYLMNRYALGSLASTPSTKEAGTRGATFLLCTRGDNEPVAQLTGVSSEYSKAFVEGTGLYDMVASTAESSPAEVLAKMGISESEKIVLVDFGGRAKVGITWATALRPVYPNFLMLCVGYEILELSETDALAVLQAYGTTSVIVNMGELLDQAIKIEGEVKYYENLQRAWESFHKEGIKGLEIR
ncbi:hypothetical protein F4820DRAFT_458821 [Hypoxylon rubiginosum]|uniref:Uncharacterized protein n=1 Tax=Hypoxylon rubiginosum TaxID=110542 RepID=A0ACB9YY74_9PEZI|nr:hypothetical protein F4820DRAFT_458821 [Hypoxylon rubiginosum]